MAAATHDSFYDMMYENALLSLAAGHPLPCDQEILSFSPLPNNLTEPYAAQEADIRQTMTMAYKAMAVWVEEAKKSQLLLQTFRSAEQTRDERRHHHGTRPRQPA